MPQKILLDPYLPLRARDLVALGMDGVGAPDYPFLRGSGRKR
ncbi:hypothetical protein [Candidatus Burkholderia verschuerenii]|nr:hypothetical protein [Candidatus Burkholderia verschuerenii]